MEPLKRDILIAVFLIVTLYVLGAIIYHYLEGWSFLDSIYFQTMTFTTVGYGDIVPKTPAGKVFTIVVSWVGISLGLYLIYSMMAYRQRTVDHRVSGIASKLLIHEKIHHAIRKKLPERYKQSNSPQNPTRMKK